MPLGKREDFGDARFSGVTSAFEQDSATSLQAAVAGGFDFVVIPLRAGGESPDTVSGEGQEAPEALSATDALYVDGENSTQVVGQISAWLRPDSPDAALRRHSEAELLRELNWAAHQSLQAVVVQLPAGEFANYARTLLQFMQSLTNLAVWISLPMLGPSTPEPEGAQPPPGDPWEAWTMLRALCEHHTQLGLILTLPASLEEPQAAQVWAGEPVRAVMVPTGLFLTNKRGFPTLSRPHQALLASFFRLGVQVVLQDQTSGARLPVEPSSVEASSSDASDAHALGNGHGAPGNGVPVSTSSSTAALRVYYEYLSFIFRRPAGASAQEQAELAYRDHLQVPLQPLKDNLESQTYEVFEKDETKYTSYEAAIRQALVERHASGQKAETSATDSTDGASRSAGPVVHIMVVGAGRGPLVRASLAAGESAGVKVKVWAVEKNPNAIITLHRASVALRWGKRVEVVSADMRQWEPPVKADILVSELLGSFGDNELSPECLDGAQRLLAAEGISIPSRYTSFLQPITASKPWSDARAHKDTEHMETPYVVKLHRFTPLSSPLPVFTFQHTAPSKGPPPDNSRYLSLRFPREQMPQATCHGFAGYFEAQLYGDVWLSTHPETHTPNMFSWFPVFFPLAEPILLPPSRHLQAHWWRCVSAHDVWYEWAVSEPATTHVHNPLGRSYKVGL